MKTVILTTVAGAFLMVMISCKNETATETKVESPEIAEKGNTAIADVPVMAFSKTDHDFGTINEGDIVKHKFTFTNTGKAPLLIISAKGSCGCTVPEWPKEPIAPGASGTLLVAFNSNGKPNLQNKQITITTNTEKGKEILKIKAMVTPKAKINS